MRRWILAAPLLGGASAAAGCSLMGLGEFDLVTYHTNEPCQPLNEALGITDQDCMVYQYRKDGEPGCELRMRDWDDDGAFGPQCEGWIDDAIELDCDDDDDEIAPSQAEACNRIDDDCDYIIDEGVFGLSHSPDTVLGVGSPSQVFSAGGALVVTVVSDAYAVDLSEPNRSVLHLSYGYQTEQDTPGVLGDGEECPDLERGLTTCDFTDAAGVPIGLDWIVAAVSKEGCGDGMLRIGYTPGGDATVVLRGPEQHSNIYLGVDPDEDNCTGASRGDGPRGAARPALAGADPAGQLRQALVAWLADSVLREECGDGRAANVEVLGVWLEEHPNMDGVKWTNATNDGIPEVVGQTRGGGRPAVAHYVTDRDEGYALAYADASGGIALHFIPLFADPPEYTFRAPDVRRTEGLLDPRPPSHLLETGADADHVALAVAQAEDDPSTLRVGMAWREGCATDRPTVRFAAARYAPGDDALVVNVPVQISDAPVVSGPAMAYVSSGFVRPGFKRTSEGPPADETTSGGWVIAWVEAPAEAEPRLRAVRTLALDGQTLGAQEPPFDVVGVPSAASPPALFATSDLGLGYAYHGESELAFVARELCLSAE